MLEVNDPALHWGCFQRCVTLGKPMFLDKPLADTLENGRRICDLLTDTPMSVTQIAMHVGYNALSNSSRMFRRCRNTSPYRFRLTYHPSSVTNSRSTITSQRNDHEGQSANP